MGGVWRGHAQQVQQIKWGRWCCVIIGVVFSFAFFSNVGVRRLQCDILCCREGCASIICKVRVYCERIMGCEMLRVAMMAELLIVELVDF